MHKAEEVIKSTQPIPADRVLGEGQVVVDREELEALRTIAELTDDPWSHDVFPENLEERLGVRMIRTKRVGGPGLLGKITFERMECE